MGEVEVPADALYGASTQRAVLNFPISGQRFPRHFIRALALMPQRSMKRGEGERDVPITVQGVAVRPGNWLYADEDGIVVMPAKA